MGLAPFADGIGYKVQYYPCPWCGSFFVWYFSVLDVVCVLNAQDDYEKNRNYWKYLKAKLNKGEMFVKGVDYSYYCEK